jgi:hypothetical protein
MAFDVPISRRSFALLAATTVIGACSSSDQASPTVPATAGQVTTPTSAPVPTTTPVTEPTTTEPPVTEAPAPVQTMPLTGLALDDNDDPNRPALVVKIDNHPEARPQSGLNAADIVFEENVEQLTRFAAVFHSGTADPVGPIRSGRTQDVALLGSFNAPLFGWSGGNPRVTNAILNSDLRQFSEGSPGFYRSKDRRSPHNLYATTPALFALAPTEAGPPPPQFQFRGDGDIIAGEDVAGVKLSMDGVRVLWSWDPPSASFLRKTDDEVHSDANDGLQLSTQNVVIMFVAYAASPADDRSPEAQTIGTGEVWVFSGGKLVIGQWQRADRLQPFSLLDAVGSPILLGPGRTFVELTRKNKAATVPATADFNAVEYP